MGGGYHRNVTLGSSDTNGLAITGRGQQHPCLLPKQRQKRRHVLAIFGRLVKQRFVNSALFTLAGSFLKRMKQYFQIGWQQQQYVPRARLVSESTSEPADVGNDEITGQLAFNTYPCMSQSVGCDAPQELQALDFNGNANTCKRPDEKRPRGRPRKMVAGGGEKPRFKQHGRPKRGKCHRSDANCQRFQKVSYHLKKCPTPRADEKVVPSQFTETDLQTSSVGTCVARQQHQIKFTPGSSGEEFSITENSHAASQTDNVPSVANEVNNGKERQVKRKRRRRLKSSALINVFEVDPKKDVHAERHEAKPVSRQHKSKDIRPRYQSWNSVILLHPKVRQSNLSFNANQENSNDWPSLAELGRPKSLIKEAATEIVKRKHAGSGAKSASMLLTDVINVESKHSDAGVDEKDSFSRTIQQKCTPNVSQRTWASVAAHSLADSTRMINIHGVSEKHHRRTPETMDNTRVCKSVVSLVKVRKPHFRPKLPYSSRVDRSKIQENSTLGKCMAERQESTKLLKTIRCKNKITKRVGQKDHTVILGITPEKRKARKGERSDKTQHMAHLLGTHRSKGGWQHIWKVDEMPVVYSLSAPPVIVLTEQNVSECDNTREIQSPATESFNSKNNVCVLADNTNGNVDAHSLASTETNVLADNLLSDIRGEQQDEVMAASSSRTGLSEIKVEIPAPVEAEPTSPKKVSVRYRALLRCDSSHLAAKTLTEMQTRNKKTNNLHETKVATRHRQRQQRQDRQATYYNSLRFHTCTYAADPNQSVQSGSAESKCPYWLRSMPASREFVQAGTLGNIMSNNGKGQHGESFEVTSTAKIKSAKLTPCRMSERLRAKARNVTWPTHFP